MTLWRTIASLAGAKGARADCQTCPDGLPDDDAGFAAAVTALGAKLAKADGAADENEFAAFSEVFRADARAHRDVRRLYGLARQTTRGFESYARQIGRRYRRCPAVLATVIEGLFHIAKSDGAVTHEELAFIARVGELFRLPPLTLRRIRAEQIGAPADDPYVLLGVSPDAPDEEVSSSWKRLLRQTHPDKLGGEAPGEALALAETRSAQLNAAYDLIRRERRDLVGAIAG